MQRLWIAGCVMVGLAGLAAFCGSAAAQQPANVSAAISPGEVTPTPDMWFYQQYVHQYQDPKLAVRRKAEFQAEQRARRLAAMRWFGMSNSRPYAHSDPYHSDYSPRWTSNNYWYPSRWAGTGRPGVMVWSSGFGLSY